MKYAGKETETRPNTDRDRIMTGTERHQQNVQVLEILDIQMRGQGKERDVYEICRQRETETSTNTDRETEH